MIANRTTQRNKRTFAIVIGLSATFALATAQDPPRSGIYQVQSGMYRAVGGIWGVLTLQLPGSNQSFILLNAADTGPAELKFLDSKQQRVFLRLTNGVVSGNVIRFQYQTAHLLVPTLPAQVDYTITNAAGHLWISGSITSSPTCCDIPYEWEHHNVRATFLPGLSIRVASEVELRWSSASNQDYQVQWLSDLTQSEWTDVCGPIHGNGSTNSVVDTLAPTPSQRFYRILPLP